MPSGMGPRGPHGGPFRGGQPRHIRRFVEPAILLLLHQAPRHGYALMEGLAELGLEQYPVDLSGIYRILRHLEQMGMVVSEWNTETAAGPPRRVYRLTPDGKMYLEAWVADLRATQEVLQRFLQAYQAHQDEHNAG